MYHRKVENFFLADWALTMQVAVELFGIARARAGVVRTTAEGRCLGDVLFDLAARFPALAETCIDGRKLRPSFAANLGGRQFVSAPETPLSEGDTVLLLSLDAGG
ncbi:MAG: MoaD/ThiS family protein [Pirellulales bacterium]